MAESVTGDESKKKLERVVWVAVIFCTVSIPFLMITIALLHIDDCPHQPHIPLVVLMAGIFMSLSNIINAADKYSPPKQTSYKKRKHIVGALNVITNCLTIACFIAGTLWVYGKGKPSYSKSSRDYCNPSLYLFSFWLFILSLVFISVMIFLILVSLLLKYMRKVYFS